uniref:C2H2-type domain-containing protein n=1 Tax=Oryzias melastigma TaxID=30732 RepID=A0A3B3BUY2_ORYME
MGSPKTNDPDSSLNTVGPSDTCDNPFLDPNDPELCLPTDTLPTDINICQEKQSESDDISSDEWNTDNLNLKSKSKLCSQPNPPNTDVHSHFEKDPTASNSKMSTTVLEEISVQPGMSEEENDPGKMNSIMVPHSSNVDIGSLSERECSSPTEKSSSSLVPDQCKSEHKAPLEQEPPIPHEDIFENARESFKEESSSCDADETNAALDQCRNISVSRSEEDNMDPTKIPTLQLKSSSQIRKKLHPIVLLNVSDSVDNSDSSYQCADCQHTTQNVDHLIEHHCRCHSGLSFEFCTCCMTGQTYQSSYSTPEKKKKRTLGRQSQTTVESTSPVSCRFCEKDFSSLKLLKQHQRCHRGERPYRCLECRKQFKQRAHLIGHKKIHQKRIQCTVCRKILPTIGELIQHRQEHLKRGPLKCPDCDLEFQYPAFLLRHVKAHENKDKKPCKAENEASTKPLESLETVEKLEAKQEQCFFCDEMFNDALTLRKHWHIHISKSSSNQCPYCNTKIRHRHNLMRHMVRHIGEKLLSCTSCGKRFNREKSLKLHAQTCLKPVSAQSENETKKHFKCSFCPRMRIGSESSSDRKCVLVHLAAPSPTPLLLCIQVCACS